MKRQLYLAGVCAWALTLHFHPATANDGQYVESFNTTTYKDPVNTTAFWDTGTGQLKLYPVVPTLVGNYNTSGFAAGVAVSGDLAVVADFDAGLRVLNITNLASPTLLGTYNSPGSAFRVVVDGDLAYLADGTSGFRVVNIANPASPTLLGFVSTSNAQDVAVAGDLAFVADAAAGLRIINVSNPAAPVIIATFNTPGNASGVAVAGDLAFIADDSFGLRIVSILNPATPTLVSFYDTPGFALKVDVTGNVAVVADANSGVVILDITNPSSPSLLGTYATPGIADDIAVNGDLVFVAADASGIQVVSISNPANPVLINSYDTTGLALGVAVSGEHAFVADEASGVQVVKVAARESMKLVATASEPLYLSIDVDGDVAVVGADDHARIYSLANPAAPGASGYYDMLTGGPTAVDISGDLAFLAGGTVGLHIISIADLEDPTLVGAYNTPGTADDIAVAGDLAFVADQTTVQIINVVNPATPSFVGSYDTPGIAQGVVVAGDLAFVADGSAGLRVINIANPATPTLAGSYDPSMDVVCVSVAGDHAYLGGDEGLQVVSIANPASPSLVGTYNSATYFQHIELAGNLAFVADYDEGVKVLDITNPAVPTLLDTHLTSPAGFIRQVRVSGEYAYVVSGDDFYLQGLQTLHVFSHEFFTRPNQGASLTVATTSNAIVAARVTTTQAGGVLWEISADAGADWQNLFPNEWIPIASEGSDLRWRSTHLTSTPHVNPAVSDLQIEWLDEFASIDAITDIPNDQGGWVRLRSTRSGRDVPNEPLPIANYGVWRRVDDTALVSTLASAPRNTDEIDPAMVEAFGALPIFGHHGDVFVESPPREMTGTLPPGTWALVANIPAIQRHNYLADIPTLADSTVDGVTYSVFVVTAHTTTPSIWYASSPDSGYSIDNIAPGVPTSFAVAYNTGSGNTLSWDPSAANDFQYFRVYRSTNPAFTPSPLNLVHSTATTGWSDPDYDGGLIYYKITALDHAGNESDPAAPEEVTSIGGTVPEIAALYQNHPNPFNPTTQIRYDVPRGGADVHLAIYDVSGRIVRALVQGREAEGAKSVEWDGRNDVGSSVATGMYFYRATIGSFTSTRKMVLLK